MDPIWSTGSCQQIPALEHWVYIQSTCTYAVISPESSVKMRRLDETLGSLGIWNILNCLFVFNFLIYIICRLIPFDYRAINILRIGFYKTNPNFCKLISIMRECHSYALIISLLGYLSMILITVNFMLLQLSNAVLHLQEINQSSNAQQHRNS